MLIHLVYEEDYVEQLKNILESAGHSVTELDYSLSQFADFSERKETHAEIALVDGQAGVATKKEIIECLGQVRKNLPYLRMIVVFQLSLEKDEAFISKLLTFSIYDMYFRDEYSIDDLESWIKNPKNYGNYNVEIEDIRGTLVEADKPKIMSLETVSKPAPVTQAKAITLPKLPQLGLPSMDVKLPSLSSVMSKIPSIRLPKKNTAQAELSWEEDSDQENAAGNTKELLGKVIWFWGSTPGLGVTSAANQYAVNLAKTLPVLLLDGNLAKPALSREYDCPGPGWECSWLAKTPGVPPKKYYTNGNLTVWPLQEPIKVADADEMWDVALFHIRTPKMVIVVDGGTFSPPDEADINIPVDQPEGEKSRVNQKITNPHDPKDAENKKEPASTPLPKPDAISCQEAIAKVILAEPTFILMVDSDGLKGINDKYGHATGTAYLTEIWDRLHNTFPDILWHRYGGDEFYGVIEGNKVSEADIIARADTITGMANIYGRDILISCSIGLYSAAKGESVIAAMAMADYAMYQVKNNHHQNNGVKHHGGIKVFRSKNRLALVGQWAEAWITVPVSEGWRVLVFPEKINPAAILPCNLIVSKRPIPNLSAPVWVPEGDDIGKLIVKLGDSAGEKESCSQ